MKSRSLAIPLALAGALLVAGQALAADSYSKPSNTQDSEPLPPAGLSGCFRGLMMLAADPNGGAKVPGMIQKQGAVVRCRIGGQEAIEPAAKNEVKLK